MTNDCKTTDNCAVATVIIPSYNSPDLLCAVDSVMRQTYDSIQMIIIDDGSESFNESEIEQHIIKNKRANLTFQIIVNEENYGTIKTLNRALQFACGSYVFMLAGDDCFYDEHVVADVMQFGRETHSLVITGYRMVCDFAMNELNIIRPLQKQVRYINKLSPKELFEKIAPENFVFGCSTVYSSKVFEEFGRFDETYRLIEDHSMLLRLLRNQVKISFIPRIMVKYRGGGTSNTTGINQSYFTESDLIFRNEVEPYTDHLKKTKKSYEKWKRKIVFSRKLAAELSKYKKGSCARYCRLLINYLLHPLYLADVLLIKLHDRRWGKCRLKL